MKNIAVGERRNGMTGIQVVSTDYLEGTGNAENAAATAVLQASMLQHRTFDMLECPPHGPSLPTRLWHRNPTRNGHKSNCRGDEEGWVIAEGVGQILRGGSDLG